MSKGAKTLGPALQETVPVSQEEDLFTHSCPSMETLFPNNPSFAKTIRDGYKYLTGVGRAFHPSPVRCVQSQGAFDFRVKCLVKPVSRDYFELTQVCLYFTGKLNYPSMIMAWSQ